MTDSYVTTQPGPKPTMKDRLASTGRKLTTKEGWVGEYDFAHLVRVRSDRAGSLLALARLPSG